MKRIALLAVGVLVSAAAFVAVGGADSGDSLDFTNAATANTSVPGVAPADKLSPEVHQVVVAQGSTTGPDHTARSEANPQSAAFTTSVGRTTSHLLDGRRIGRDVGLVPQDDLPVAHDEQRRRRLAERIALVVRTLGQPEHCRDLIAVLLQ
jgi:hypothetical protein